MTNFRHRMRPPRSRQQGMVLLMVLLIFAVVAMIAANMVERQAVDIERAQTLFSQQQARQFALGAESATRTGLYLDWKANSQLDHALEEWAQPRTFPLDPGVIEIHLADLQGRFNLNSMLPGGSVSVYTQRFRNLLNLLGADVTIADRWQKWLDPNSNVDNQYLSQEPGYRPAYAECKHTSELMLIEGVDLAVYAMLEPYIACLPASAQLNVNTASDFVLASIDSRLNLTDAAQLVAGRGSAGYASVDDFMTSNTIANLSKGSSGRTTSGRDTDDADQTQALNAADFSVFTQYFEMFARVDLNGRIGTVEAVIHRLSADGSMTTIQRDFSRRAARQVAPPGQ